MKPDSPGNLLAAATLCVVLSCGSAGREGRQAAGDKTLDDKTFLPAGCEDSEALLDRVANEARAAAAGGGTLIAIARDGSIETSAKINRERLSAVKKFLAGRDIPARAIVAAEGERAGGLGRVDFYIGGSLFMTLQARRHRGICIECCNPAPEDFLPRPKRRRPRD